MAAAAKLREAGQLIPQQESFPHTPVFDALLTGGIITTKGMYSSHFDLSNVLPQSENTKQHTQRLNDLGITWWTNSEGVIYHAFTPALLGHLHLKPAISSNPDGSPLYHADFLHLSTRRGEHGRWISQSKAATTTHTIHTAFPSTFFDSLLTFAGANPHDMQDPYRYQALSEIQAAIIAGSLSS